MFDYDLIRIECDLKNEEARIAYFEFHSDDEIDTETEHTETEIDKEIIYTIENF